MAVATIGPRFQESGQWFFRNFPPRSSRMFTLTMPIARKHNRQRMRRAGWLTIGDDSPPISCMIWDFSEGGCRLTAPHAGALPQLFTLTINPNSGVQHHCRVIWQRGTYGGVKFIDAAEAAWL